ncbi:radical SAM protein, partial [bacterium]|nr:radical SAM protein [bacterium]
TSFDAGRGCPFKCSFCTIINVQGRKPRNRVGDDIEQIMRTNAAQGISNFFICDDNFARNRDWEDILDRLIKLREKDGLKMRFVIQVDTLCHKIPGFIKKAAQAGVTRVFIGMESINPEALKGIQKRQNRITEYRTMIEAWHNVGALTYAGYILGFPADTPESILRDIKTIQRELPVDLLEFFILTPLPGSQDHKTLYERGAEMESDMNKYDVVHVTTLHPKMSKKEWQDIYHKAWETYYTREHVKAIMQRTKEWGFSTHEMMSKLFSFYDPAKFEKIHPLEWGILRLKYRKDRRYKMPIENPLVFYPRYMWDTLKKYTRFICLFLRYKHVLRNVEKEASKIKKKDMTITPVQTS